MLTEEAFQKANLERKYFIEDRSNATFFQWITSKGTNFSCYLNYLDTLDTESLIEIKIDTARTILYALNQPLWYPFFYWTILIFILRKFNFKNKILRIILIQFILRCTGDIINRFGELWPRYYSTSEKFDDLGNVIEYDCSYDASSPEMHPLRWFLTRQIGNVFWYVAEIFMDWYPLIRTREIVKTARSIWFVYLTCGLFNLSKITLIVLHFTSLSPTNLYKHDTGAYNKDDVDMFYFKYWLIQLLIIYSSVIYDFSVYYVLRKYSFQINISQIGFVQKFKVFSIYRIRVSLLVSILFLPLVSIAIILKFYYYDKYHYHKLEFSFDDIRISIANLQYLIVFIDQILLAYTESRSRQRNQHISHAPSANSNSDFKSTHDVDSQYFYKNLNYSNTTLVTDFSNNNTIQRKSSSSIYPHNMGQIGQIGQIGQMNHVNFETMNSNFYNINDNININSINSQKNNYYSKNE